MSLPDHYIQSHLLIILSIHLKVINDIFQEDTFTEKCSHFFNEAYVREMHMQMVKCRIVMEQCLNLRFRKPKLLLDGPE